MRVSLIENHEDLEKVKQLAHQIWPAHYTEIIGAEQVDYMLHNLYSLENLIKQLQQGDLFYLLEDRGVFLGYASVKLLEDGTWFLNKLYVQMSEQGKGRGRFLLEYLIQENRIKELRLQVNRQNYKAINFYFKSGFIIERVADFDIGDGYFMNDFVMLKK
jgi:GNAT superfamily N-acetyltransferase